MREGEGRGRRVEPVPDRQGREALPQWLEPRENSEKTRDPTLGGGGVAVMPGGVGGGA